MTLLQKLAQKLAQTQFGIKSVHEKTNLEIFKQRPSFRVMAGISLMGISYIIGWPAIGVLGVASYTYDLPLLFVIGGPVLYGISHLFFFLGLYLAGTNYAKVFFKWIVRRFIEKYDVGELENN
jgi:hypothetical protein